MQGLIVGDLAGRDLSRFARSARSSSQLVATSLPHRDGTQRNIALAQLVAHGAAHTLQSLLRSPERTRFDWHQRDATGATLLMAALRDGSRAVVDSLLEGPPALFAGMDGIGWNVLHHAVSRGQSGILCAMLERHPALAAYADCGTNRTVTPLHMAYAQRDDTLFGLLLVTPLPRIAALIRPAAGTPPPPEALLPPAPPSSATRVYPFDAAGRPLDDAARESMSNHHFQRDPTASRLALLHTAIADSEPDFVRALLKRLEPETLAAARDTILTAAVERGHFATARAVVGHFGEGAFAPLSNGATLCHLAARRLNDDVLHWLLDRPGARAMLRMVDDDGRTPLQCAAAEGSMRCFAALHCHYPDLSLRDAYRRGALQLLFRADPAAAHRVLESPALQARLTPADLTETLQAALRKVLEFDFDQSWQPNDDNTLEVHVELIDALLALPAGRIDVQAPIGESGHSIFSLLESGTLASLLERGSEDEQREVSDSIRDHYARYQNDALLARARAHLTPAAAQPVPDPLPHPL